MERDYYKKNIRDKEVLKQKSTDKILDKGSFEMHRSLHEKLFFNRTKGMEPKEVSNTPERRNIKESLGKYSKLKAESENSSGVSERERLKAHFLEAASKKEKDTPTVKKQKRSIKGKIKDYPNKSSRFEDRILYSATSTAGKYAVAKGAQVASSDSQDEEESDSVNPVFDSVKSSGRIYNNTVGSVYVKKATSKNAKSKQKAHPNEPYKVQNDKTVRSKYKQSQSEHKSLMQRMEETKEQIVKVAARIKEMFSVKKKLLLFIGAIVLAVVIAIVAVFSVAVGVANGIGIYILGTSMTEDFHMTEADNYFTEMEMQLQETIDSIEEDYPEFDEYVFDVDEIGHDPILLMAFLSGMYESYTLDEVKYMLDEIFERLYTLELIEAIEERSRWVYNEESGEYEEEIYEVKVLYVTLTKADLLQILEGLITDDEVREQFEIYTDTQGAHQSYINPFSLDWVQHVSSHFGWRIHPISGQEKFHNGVDIALPTGTNIGSVSKGKVIQSYYSQSAGNYIVIEDESGYRCHYMHLNERYVSVGDEVNYGDVIGTVGNTGNSTGPHLHLGVQNEDRKWINPLFVVSNYVS